MTTKTEIKLFTIEQANASLPLVRAIVRDIVHLSNSILDCRQRLDELSAGREDEESDIYDEELAQTEEILEQDTDRLKSFMLELQDLGVELKSMTEGLVDFPSMMDDRLVYLCWKYGEEEVAFWHEVQDGFDGRQEVCVLAHDRIGS